jgi:hypothetical protein
MFLAHLPEARRAEELSTIYNVARLAQMPAQALVAVLFAETGTLASALGLSAACCLAAIVPFRIASRGAP